MGLQDDIRILSTVPLFAGMNDDQMRLVAFGAERRHLSAGQTLFREKAPAECAYIVAEGRIELLANGRDGKPVLKETVGPGMLLSELALMTLVERKYTAVAQGDAEVLRITRALFQRLMEEYPVVAVRAEARLRDNIAGMIDDIAALERFFA
ncbi:MAG: protein kinase [Rhizobium sp. 63-7]|nr:MAG: protein kinase [Rhizobium sp. 63-7]